MPLKLKNALFLERSHEKDSPVLVVIQSYNDSELKLARIIPQLETEGKALIEVFFIFRLQVVSPLL